MALSHERRTYFMTNEFTKSIPQRENVGQTVPDSKLFKAKAGLTNTVI